MWRSADNGCPSGGVHKSPFVRASSDAEVIEGYSVGVGLCCSSLLQSSAVSRIPRARNSATNCRRSTGTTEIFVNRENR